MNEHTTSDTSAADGRDPHIDLVAGDPPVPITVWRTVRHGDDQNSIGSRLAYRLVSAYSRPGESIIDLTADHALSAAAVRGRRRHLKAWFTSTASIIIGPPTPIPSAGESGGGREAAGGRSGWFGDDLTDGDLPPHDDPAGPDGQPAVESAGAASLVVARWPLDESGTRENLARLGWLLAVCARLLRPGGCLVLVVAVPDAAAVVPEDFGPLVRAAGEAGLGYLQHIVAVAADVDGDRFTFYATDEELLALARGAGEGHLFAHLKVHADLLVFTRQQAPAGSRNRAGAEREPGAGSGGDGRG